MPSLGLQAIASVLVQGTPEAFIENNFQGFHFRAAELPVFEYVQQHLLDFGGLPSEQTIKDKVLSFSGFQTQPNENPKYYMAQLTKRMIVDNLQDCIIKAQPFLAPSSLEPETGLRIIEDQLLQLTVQTHHKQIVDFRKARNQILQDLKQKALTVGDYWIRTGWKYLDDMTHGLVGGVHK